ncbi:hydroxylase [Pseudoalteromonas luteoviolacea]|uniref:VOC family protein n=1 Tax=Pseudoalteromonas luteoviolacea TaxID=43657 RepID=UPI001B381F9B|nr:hydroxylase [Pseudoalteromonas luteoviolacea]MBQ4809744.1 hydroxylase [Pseudoalteromonas luteoviolacea]
MKIQYLEIVTLEVDTVCNTYSDIYDIEFSEIDLNLGNARIAHLSNGGLIGIRAPLRQTETPTVRHYTLVKDINEAVSKSEQAGAIVALPPMELSGYGTCAIVIQSGIEIGFWQICS